MRPPTSCPLWFDGPQRSSAGLPKFGALEFVKLRRDDRSAGENSGKLGQYPPHAGLK